MVKDLHNLNNCPNKGVAVKEVNENKEERRKIALEVGNRSVKEEKEFGIVKGEDTINRVEATRALYKVVDGIVAWGISTYPTDIDYTKIKPKQIKSIWEDICIVKGYDISKTLVEPEVIHISVIGNVTLGGEYVTKESYIDNLNNIIKEKGINCRFMDSKSGNCDYVVCKEIDDIIVCESISFDKVYNCEDFIKNIDYDFLGISKKVCVENLFKAYNDMVAHMFNWTSEREKDMLYGVGITPKEFKDLYKAYDRLTKYRGLCGQMEWLYLALEYLHKNTDCLMYLADKIDVVLRYQFSMDLPLERALVRELSRHCRTSDKFKNVSIVETLVRINRDGNRLLHLVPTARHIHEVYEMPFDSGICKLEYMSVPALEDCLSNGDTLSDYKSVCYFRGKLPESIAVNLINKLNDNRVSKGLSPISL